MPPRPWPSRPRRSPPASWRSEGGSRVTYVQSIVIQRHGGPEVLTLQERELKPLQSHEALIRIATVGVNYVDVYWRSGFDPQSLPLVPGLEAAGVVEAVGAG